MTHSKSVIGSEWPRSLAAASCAVLLATPAWADQAAEDRPARQLEAVVVTATKYEENLQAVPLSLTAFSGDTMDALNISGFQDLDGRVPGFNYDRYSDGQPRYYIRGVGNNLQSGSVEESVGVFMDGVYLERPAMGNMEFLDLERVEVLRGPQGTLFGRNVVGGAVSFITRVPTEELRMGGNATYGKFNEFTLKGYLSGPLSERVFGSISGVSGNRDGYAFNTDTGNRLDDRNYAAMRTALRFVPGDNLEMILRADTSRGRALGTWWILVEPGPQPAPSGLLSPWRNNYGNDDGVNDVDNFGASVELNWNIGVGTLTSITAHRSSKYVARANLIPPNIPDSFQMVDVVGNLSDMIFYRDFEEDADQYSQEIRFTAEPSAKLRFVGGAYYHHSKVFHRHDVIYAFVFNQRQGLSGSISNTETDAYAAFANLRYSFTDSLDFQVGARWSKDDKSGVTEAYGVPTGGAYVNRGVRLPPGVGYTVSNSKDWSAFTPSYSLNYEISPTKFAYATVSRGFKSGGFAGGQTDQEMAETPFDPEYAWNYEIGLKSDWLDNRLRVNLTAFMMDYTSLQVRGLVPDPNDPNLPSQRVFLNAGKASIEGLEAEITAFLTDRFDVGLAYSYTDAQIDKTDARAAGVLRVGDQLVKAAEHQLFVSAGYRVPIGNAMELRTRADYGYRSEYYPQLPNNPLEEVPSAMTVNALIQLASLENGWTIELWGKNLTDEVTLNSLTLVRGGTTGFLNPPRTYGITLKARY